MNRGLAQSMCFTKYLIQRDCLTTSFTRMGSGFTPPTVIAEAKHYLTNIQTLVNQMEDLSKKPKDAIVAEDWHRFERDCCGRD
jgi:hypothetical protein